MKKIYKLAALLTAFVCASTAMFAQNSMTPYSMYGYGMLNDNSSSMQRQMGGVGYAMSSGRQINAKNPASYASIDSLTFIFDIGADISFLHSAELRSIEKDENKANQIGGGLDYITMQFPIGKYMGASLGLIPYSSVGYAFGNEIMHGTLNNQGTGGITQAYVGIAGKYAGVSLGANISYNWGNIINDTYAVDNSGNRSLFEHVMQIRDWNINLGAMYTLILQKYHKINLGITYQPKKSFHGNTWGAYWDIGADKAADTVGYTTMSGKYYQPNTIGSGISYTYNRGYRMMFEVDFQWQDWAKAKYEPLFGNDGEVLFSGMQFDNRWKISAGGEFVPKTRGGNYIQHITYRLGGHYTNDYLMVNGNKVKDYGLSCGFGLPTIEGRTMINIGFEWLHRRAAPEKLISENYFNITVGINFNEMWFWQRKLR